MEICRMFDLFEITMLIVLTTLLIVVTVVLTKWLRQDITAGKLKSKRDWIIYFIPVMVGSIIGTIVQYGYYYIKSMFC